MLLSISARVLAALAVAAVAWVVGNSPSLSAGSAWLAAALGGPASPLAPIALWSFALGGLAIATPLAFERRGWGFDVASATAVAAPTAVLGLAGGFAIEPILAAIAVIWAQCAGEERERAGAASPLAAMAGQLDAAMAIDVDGVVRDANAAAADLFGRDLVDQEIGFLAPDIAALAASGATVAPMTVAARDAGGAPIQIEIAGRGVDARRGRLWIVTLRDVTNRETRLAELEKLALHDALTGLPNRLLLHDRISQALSAAERGGGQLAVLLMDLNRFKRVNDTLGHHVGDELLRAVGPRLSAPLRKSDTLARMGGDEFAVLLPAPAEPSAVREVAERLARSLDDPFQIDGMVIDVGVSIGVALFPTHGRDAETLLRCADAAMYVAKRGGVGFCVFDEENDEVGESKLRLDLQSDLKRGIERDELELFFQPQVATATAHLVGVEALMRWRHPRHGLLPPDQFIAMAEQSGLFMPLTEWLLDECLRNQKRWREHGRTIAMALNLTPKSLQSDELPGLLRAAFATYDADPAIITFEITEAAIMLDNDRSRRQMAEIAELGCRFALDDFGTGFSSLGRLPNLAVDELKIDRSFVAAMQEIESSAVVVRAIVRLAHGLGLTVIAEGVEDEETERRLAELGCDRLQGFRFGRPMNGEEFDQWLDAASAAQSNS